ncbi:disease resistance-like protein DSC1 isoform X3 [Pistacia vera]|nr:disease resistance-like protein DSC1 isoform X3 [Pistacia vera]
MINTFIDDELKRGDQISPSLFNAIERSKISLIIFSKEYSSLLWCLEELVKILECKNSYGQIVIPVFYGVYPSDVGNQIGTFGDAFIKLEKRFKSSQETLQRWRTALREAANLSGFDSNVIRSESTLVQKVVDDILEKLNEDFPLIENKNLVGVDSRIEYIERLLCTSVQKIGIWGIGGIGKTTLAKAVFNKISGHFESYYFVENIREESESSKGLADLHQQLIFAILKDKHANIGSNFTKRRLACKKVLIVFDDVTNSKQIESLIGQFEFGSGSRFMITARDKRVLENCDVDGIYETKILSDDAAHQLFSRHAFRQECPPEEFRKLAQRVLSYAKGVPLALEVLGSSLYKRTKKEWESYIKRLSRIPDMNIQKVLKVSYDGLNDEEQEVFLDIACFFKGYDRDLIEAILDGCGFASHYDINVLIERSLITASSNTITMHDLLQDMGREIIRQESIDDPGRRSRLWDHEDILKVLIKNKGTEVIRSMRLDMFKVSESHLKLEDFKNMQNLKFLKVYGCKHDEEVPGLEVLESDSCLLCLDIFKPYFERFFWKFFEKNSSEHEKKLHGFEVLKSTFHELRYLRWDGYAANLLPPKFNPRNLVVLDMPCSKLKQLWNDDLEHNLVNLKHIDLRYSQHLRRMPNLSLFPNLESLILKGCRNMCNIFSSTHNLDKLVVLNLRGCKNMDMLSISPQCRTLRKVILSDCSNLKTISYIPCAVEELDLDGAAIEELPSLEHLSRLEKLILWNCSELKNLPESIRGCKSLKYLYLSHSSKLDSLPEGLGNLTALKTLLLFGISLREVPPSIACLNNLETFVFVRCTIENPLSLLPHDSSFLNKLTFLDLSDSCIKELPSNLGQLRSLEHLEIRGNNFESLPGTIKDLPNLLRFNLSNCQRLKSLPELPHQLAFLEASGCISLEELSSVPTRGKDEWGRVNINFNNCCKLKLHAKALLNIQSDAVLWFHNKEKESNMLEEQDIDSFISGNRFIRGTIFYPGSEISDWFDFISSENSIKLPMDHLNDNVIGFALCVVLSSPCKSQALKDCYLSARFDLFVDEKLVFHAPLCNGDKDQSVSKSDLDYVIIGFQYIILSELHPLSSNSKGFFKFSVDDRSLPYKLKECGVKLLYVKDNDLRTDARVDRDQRLKSINGSDDDSI